MYIPLVGLLIMEVSAKSHVCSGSTSRIVLYIIQDILGYCRMLYVYNTRCNISQVRYTSYRVASTTYKPERAMFKYSGLLYNP